MSLFSFLVIIEEVICKKDNAEIMRLTIFPRLTDPMKEIAKRMLSVKVGD